MSAIHAGCDDTGGEDTDGFGGETGEGGRGGMTGGPIPGMGGYGEGGNSSGGAGLGGAGLGGSGLGGAHAGGSGGLAESGGTGGTGGEPVRACELASTALCDGFDGALDTSVWHVYKGQSGSAVPSYEIDDTRAHSGPSSLHARVVYSDVGSGFVELRQETAIPAPDLYARAHVYVPSSSASGRFVMSMVEDTSGGYSAVGVGLDEGELALMSWGNGKAVGHANEPFPFDRWVCLEWRFNGASDTVTVWRDGQLAIDETPMTYGGSADTLWFGIYGSNNPSGPVDVWIDDVALGTAPLGCD